MSDDGLKLVQRFDPSLMGTREDWADCIPTENGEYVLYSDFATERAARERAERERDDVVRKSTAYNPTPREAEAIMAEAAAIARAEAAEARIAALEAERGRVAVKPLEWKPFHTGDGREYTDAPFGISYHVSREGWWRPLDGLNECNGIEAAKAAAQADYEQRVRSAIMAPAVTEEAVERACEVVLRELEIDFDGEEPFVRHESLWRGVSRALTGGEQ